MIIDELNKINRIKNRVFQLI